ncbi:MAG TPA: sigma-70 family RNA polymerase sigma factor [Gemmatales bacterium]|nr:sigma-70 family RNA polymerase sigma factor [Gemmatales bacterium]
MPSESDKLLVQDIRKGDTDAWQRLIDRYEGRLLAFARRRLSDRSQAEDIVQEAFVGFLNSLPNFDEERDLQTYLFTIAAHKLTDYLRKLGRHPLQHIPDGQEFFEGKTDHRPRVSSLARSRERMDLEENALTKALKSILTDWREQGDYVRIKVLELLFVTGWSNKDVADELNIKDQQVANIRFAAVRKITEMIQEAGLPLDVFPGLQQESEGELE